MTIITDPHPTLHQKASPVGQESICGYEIKELISAMKNALLNSHGVALAAPQINNLKRIFIAYKEPLFPSEKNRLQEQGKIISNDITVYINPEIIAYGDTVVKVSEGCLSVTDLYGVLERHKDIIVKAFNEYGEEFMQNTTGLLAQIIQHETDHLNGILFTDKAIKTVTKEELEKKKVTTVPSDTVSNGHKDAGS